ncbi:hypothetical protein L3Q82_017853, partial [Scortum barcoo]
MVLDRKRVACPLRMGGEVLPQVEEFKYLWVLFTSEGKMECKIDRRIGAAFAVDYAVGVPDRFGEEGAESKGMKLSIYYFTYAPTLTYGHELWVMTERTRSCGYKQSKEMSFLCRGGWRSLRDRVRSSVTREELGVEPPLLLHIERSQLRWLGHLYRMPPGRMRHVPPGGDPGKTQDTLGRICLSAGLATPRNPAGRAGGSVWDIRQVLLLNTSTSTHPNLSSVVGESLRLTGLIRPPSSTVGAGFFFVAKKDGSMHPCIYYSLLNETVKNRIREGDERKSSFNNVLRDFLNLAEKCEFHVRSADQVFCRLKGMFSSALILTIPDPQRQFVVEVDASNDGLGAVLSQHLAKYNKLYPCTFLSRKSSPAEKIWCQACVWRQPGEEYKDKCVLPLMVWGYMSAEAGIAIEELQFTEGTMNANMYCDILKQSMIPSLRKLGRRALFQHDNDPKHTSKTTTALLKKLRVKVLDWPSMSPDLNPIEQLWGILKRKLEERKVSNIHQLRDVVMEEWKRIPVATCEALVNSMLKRVKAVLENNGGHTKVLTLWAQFGHFHLGGNDCEYRKVIVDWRELNHLQVNTSKEMVIDFSRKPSSNIAPVNIQGLDIERVRTYKYLGVHLNNKLDWTDNTDSLYKKGQSRLYMLRRLGSFGVCRPLLRTFYETVVASVVSYAMVCWGGGCSERDKKRLNRLIKRASSVWLVPPGLHR